MAEASKLSQKLSFYKEHSSRASNDSDMTSRTTEASIHSGTPTSSKPLNSRLRKFNVNTEATSEEDKKGKTRKNKVHGKIYRCSGVQRISSNLMVNTRCNSIHGSPSSSIARPRHEYTTRSSVSKMKYRDSVFEGDSSPEVSSSYEKEPSLSDTRPSSVEPVEESPENQDYEQPTTNILHSMGADNEPEWLAHCESRQPAHGIPNLAESIERIGDGDDELNTNGGKSEASILTTTGEISHRHSEAPENTRDSLISNYVLTNRESNALTSHVFRPSRPTERRQSQDNVVDEHSEQDSGCVDDLLQCRVFPQKESQMTEVIEKEGLDEDIVYKQASAIEDNEVNVEPEGNCHATLVVGCCGGGGETDDSSREISVVQDTSNKSEEGPDIYDSSFESNYDKHCDIRKQLEDGNHGVYYASQSITKGSKYVCPNVSDMYERCESSISECDCLGTTETDSLLKTHHYGSHENLSQFTMDPTLSSESSSEIESSYCNIQSSNGDSDKSKGYSPWVDVPVLPTSVISEDTTPYSGTENRSTPDIRFPVTMSSANDSGSGSQVHCENTSCSFLSEPLSLGSDSERFETFDGGGVSPTYINYDVLSDLDSLTADGFEFNQLDENLVSVSDRCIEGYLNIFEAVNQDGIGQEQLGGFESNRECIGQASILSSTRTTDVFVDERLAIVTNKRLSDASCEDGVKSHVSFAHSSGISKGCRTREDRISLSHISPIGGCAGGLRTISNKRRVQGRFDAHEPCPFRRIDSPSSCLTRAMTRGWTVGSLFPVDDVFLYHNESADSAGLDNSSTLNPSRGGSTNESKLDESDNSFSFEVLGQSQQESLRNSIRCRFVSPVCGPRLFNSRDPTLPRPQISPTSFSIQNPNNRSCPLASSTPRKCQEFLRRRSSAQAKQMEDFSVQDTVNLFLTMTSPLKSGRTLFL